MKRIVISMMLAAMCASAEAQQHFNGARAYQYAKEIVGIGPRWVTSAGHAKAEAYFREHFKHDKLEEDTFTANTPIGPVPMRNFIVRYQGKKPCEIVLASHYETNYWLRDINFVGANDGAATSGLLMAIADGLRPFSAGGKTLEGCSVWLVFFDGEESINRDWSDTESTYGSRHLAAKWGREGTLASIRAFILTDMIGDRDLDIQQESRAPQWLVDTVAKAARKFGDEKYFFKRDGPVSDDHVAFADRGVATIDLIDLDYGPNNSFHHTDKDTLDKISAKSLTIDGDVILESIRLVGTK